MRWEELPGLGMWVAKATWLIYERKYKEYP
jgi:hypothetical protein